MRRDTARTPSSVESSKEGEFERRSLAVARRLVGASQEGCSHYLLPCSARLHLHVMLQASYSLTSVRGRGLTVARSETFAPSFPGQEDDVGRRTRGWPGKPARASAERREEGLEVILYAVETTVISCVATAWLARPRRRSSAMYERGKSSGKRDEIEVPCIPQYWFARLPRSHSITRVRRPSTNSCEGGSLSQVWLEDENDDNDKSKIALKGSRRNICRFCTV